MLRRTFVSGFMAGMVAVLAIIAGIGFAWQGADGNAGLAPREHLFTGDQLGFVTTDAERDVVTGHFVIKVDGVWKELRSLPDVRMMPID